MTFSVDYTSRGWVIHAYNIDGGFVGYVTENQDNKEVRIDPNERLGFLSKGLALEYINNRLDKVSN